MASDHGDPERQAQLSVLRAHREDAKVVLAWFSGPAWERVRERYCSIRERYEQMLHNPNIDKDVRERACVGVVVADEFLNVQKTYERQLKFAETKLAELEKEDQPTEGVIDRILTFMR